MNDGRQAQQFKHLDLSRAPYVLYGVKYIDLVSLTPDHGPSISIYLTWVVRPYVGYNIKPKIDQSF